MLNLTFGSIKFIFLSFIFSSNPVLKVMWPEGKLRITEVTKRPLTAATLFKNSMISLVENLACKVCSQILRIISQAHVVQLHGLKCTQSSRQEVHRKSRRITVEAAKWSCFSNLKGLYTFLHQLNDICPKGLCNMSMKILSLLGHDTAGFNSSGLLDFYPWIVFSSKCMCEIRSILTI